MLKTAKREQIPVFRVMDYPERGNGYDKGRRREKPQTGAKKNSEKKTGAGQTAC